MSIATNARGTRYGDQSAYVVCLLRDTCENCKKRLMMTHCAPSKAVNINIFYCSTPIRALWKQFNERLEFIK